MSDRARHVAFHEAAHATAAFHLVHFVKIVIIGTDREGGCVHSEPRNTSHKTKDQNFEDQLVIMLAGREGSLVWGQDEAEADAGFYRGDFVVIKGIVENAGYSDPDRFAEDRRLRKISRGIVEKHQVEIERVARKLEETPISTDPIPSDVRAPHVKEYRSLNDIDMVELLLEGGCRECLEIAKARAERLRILHDQRFRQLDEQE